MNYDGPDWSCNICLPVLPFGKAGCSQPRNRQLDITPRIVGGSFAELVEGHESGGAAG